MDNKGIAMVKRNTRIKATSDEQYYSKVLSYYADTCGNYGKDTFVSVILPSLEELYGQNHRKKLIRAREIIDEAGSKKRSEIDGYLSGVLEQDIKLKKSMITLSEIERIICDTIRSCEKSFNADFSCEYNVIGAIIFGSFAKGYEHPRSDLDLLFLTRWKNIGRVTNISAIGYIDNFDPRKDIDFEDHFQNSLSRSIDIEIDNIYGSICIEDKQNMLRVLFDEKELIDGKYKVVSPYRWVHNKIIDYVEK